MIPSPSHPARAALVAVLAPILAVVVPAEAGEPRHAATTLTPPPQALVDLGSRASAPIIARPPRDVRPPTAPTALYLHGIHGRPENGCPWFASDAFGWVVCPAAPHLEGGVFSWANPAADEAVVQRALDAVHEAGARSGPVVLVGFSQGAYVAARIAPLHPGRFRALVLVGADTPLDPQALRHAGIGRVALLAGDFDGTSAAMQKTAAKLARAGIDARFESLGKTGHTYVPATDVAAVRLAETLAWAASAADLEANPSEASAGISANERAVASSR